MTMLKLVVELEAHINAYTLNSEDKLVDSVIKGFVIDVNTQEETKFGREQRVIRNVYVQL